LGDAESGRKLPGEIGSFLNLCFAISRGITDSSQLIKRGTIGTRNMAFSMSYNGMERVGYVIEITTLPKPAIRYTIEMMGFET